MENLVRKFFGNIYYRFSCWTFINWSIFRLETNADRQIVNKSKKFSSRFVSHHWSPVHSFPNWREETKALDGQHQNRNRILIIFCLFVLVLLTMSWPKKNRFIRYDLVKFQMKWINWFLLTTSSFRTFFHSYLFTFLHRLFRIIADDFWQPNNI